MKNLLFVILVVVAAVLLWAIRAEAYANGLVFLLGLVATALSSYLIADYFFKADKKSLQDNLHVSQKENQAIKERVELLQTQLNTMTPQLGIDEYEQRIVLLETEKNKIDGLSRVQTAEIASLVVKLDILQKKNDKLQEETMVTSETSKTQVMALQEELASIQLKNKALLDENTALHNQNGALIVELETKIGEKGLNTEGGNDGLVLDDTVVTGRGLEITELEIDDEDDAAAEDYGTSDNLQAIDGIGDKVSAALKDADMQTWETLSMTSVARLRVILDNAGLHNVYPISWPEQARLLVHREYSKLKKYKAYIAGN